MPKFRVSGEITLRHWFEVTIEAESQEALNEGLDRRNSPINNAIEEMALEQTANDYPDYVETEVHSVTPENTNAG